MTLLRRLQTRGSRPYRLQQRLSIHGHEKFELQASLLSLGTFLLSLPNRLPSRQGKRSYRYLVTIPSEECWRRKQLSCRKRQDPAPPAVFVSQSIWSIGWLKSTLPSSLGLHMRNDCLSLVVPVLGLLPKRHSLRQPLHYQHRRHETTLFQAAGKLRGSKAFQRNCRRSGGLGRCWASAAIPRTLIYPRDHPLRGDKLSLQWSSYRTFWH